MKNKMKKFEAKKHNYGPGNMSYSGKKWRNSIYTQAYKWKIKEIMRFSVICSQP